MGNVQHQDFGVDASQTGSEGNSEVRRSKRQRGSKWRLSQRRRSEASGGTEANSRQLDGVSRNGMELEREPLLFHETHSTNVHVSADGRVARRLESFCRGICFMSRPVAVGERVYLRVAETAACWSGMLRVGVTSRDPVTIRGLELPKYACPDLTSQPGFWAKAVSERYAEQGTLLHFYVDRNGVMWFGTDGQDRAALLSNVSVTGPLWPLVDIYGNSVAVQVLQASEVARLGASEQLPGSSDAKRRPATAVAATAASTASAGTVTSRYFTELNSALRDTARFSGAACGAHVRIDSERRTAARNEDEYCNAYVFLDTPLAVDTALLVRVVAVEGSYAGSLAVGLTACDPTRLRGVALPDDSDALLDRAEYWLVARDVLAHPRAGDELALTLRRSGGAHDGQLLVFRNGVANRVLQLCVDLTAPLFVFLDVYGKTTRIELMGSAAVPQSAPRASGASSPPKVANEAAVRAPSRPQRPLPHGALVVALPPASGNPQPATAPTQLTVSLLDADVPEIGPFSPASAPSLRPAASMPSSVGAAVSNFDLMRFEDDFAPVSHNAASASSASSVADTLSRLTGAVQQLSIGDSQLEAVNNDNNEARAVSTNVSHAARGNAEAPAPTAGAQEDCVVCWEKRVDCALYTCGHVCMCYDCARSVARSRSPHCPICRRSIQDVIKIYVS